MPKPKRYNISPARGQALLNFDGRIFPNHIDLFEAEKIEEINNKKAKQVKSDNKQAQLNADFRNLLLQGDCLSVCAYLKSQNIKVDLVYIDPPFASGANYAKKIYLRNGGKTQFENNNNSIGEEVMYGDIWQKEDYLNWLYERLLAIREIISETGSIYVHLDWHIGHYAKVLLDEVFGEENFINEIIWSYRSGGASKQDSLPKKHDTILFYRKSNGVSINPILERQYLEKDFMGSKQDEQGRFYVDTLMRDVVVEGLFNRVMPNGDIKIYNTRPVLNLSTERVDYNTQKPMGLIELLLEIASKDGQIIADFFSGSGTTVKVANDLGRKFIACDIGVNAIQTTRDRLVKSNAEFDVLKIKDGLRLFRNPAQTTAKLFSLIDGYKDRAELDLVEFWDGGIAVSQKTGYVPIKFIGLDKKLTCQELDAILEEVYALEDTADDEVAKVKIIYAFREIEVDQDYVNKEIRRAKKTGIEVELVSLDDLLSEKSDYLFSEDNASIEVKTVSGQTRVKIKKYFSPYLKAKIKEYNDKRDLLKNDSKQKIQLSDDGLELIESVQFDTTLQKNGVWKSNLDLEDKAGLKDKIKGEYILPSDKFKIKIRNIAGDEIVIDYSKLA